METGNAVAGVQWAPVVFAEVIYSWVYYTFVFRYSRSMVEVGAGFQATVILILFHIFFILIQVSFWRTILTNPGKIPRNFPEAYEQEQGNTFVEKNSKGDLRICNRCPPIPGKVIVKPDRAHHCRVCKACHLRMDHHCPFVNSCVGFFNHKYFLLFLSYTVLCAILVAITTAPGVFKQITHGKGTEKTDLGPKVGGGAEDDILVLISFILCAIFGAGLGLFTGTHYFYVLTNQTTIEALEKRRSGWINVYNIGWRKNFEQVFGSNPLLWFLPIGKGVGDGVFFPTNIGVDSSTDRAALLESNPNPSAV